MPEPREFWWKPKTGKEVYKITFWTPAGEIAEQGTIEEIIEDGEERYLVKGVETGNYILDPDQLISLEETKKTPIAHERIEEPMPGEIPSVEELEEWYKKSLKLVLHLQRRGFKEEAKQLYNLFAKR